MSIILDHYPLSSRLKGKHIGYWRCAEAPHLPDPQSFIDASWDEAQRSTVVKYLRTGKTKTFYDGWSTCRICRIPNGAVCQTDGMYTWPEGYAHYVEAHDLKPPKEFIDHVMNVIMSDNRCPHCGGPGLASKEIEELLQYSEDAVADMLPCPCNSHRYTLLHEIATERGSLAKDLGDPSVEMTETNTLAKEYLYLLQRRGTSKGVTHHNAEHSARCFLQHMQRHRKVGLEWSPEGYKPCGSRNSY